MTTKELKKEFEFEETSDGIVITRWNGKGSKCVIPSEPTIIGIGQWAFSDCSHLTEIAIPDSVISISRYAFKGCSNLTNIIIPSGVTVISDGTFTGCDSLINIAIPDGVTSIGRGAFSSCSSLTALQVGEKNQTYTSIDGVLFNKDKTKLLVYPRGKQSEYIIPNGVTSIGEDAFSGCGMTEITIPNSVTSIGGSAFSSCDMTEIAIPDSVKSIGEDAFSGCENLTAVHLPHKLKEINDNTFDGCTRLKMLELPDSLRKIKMWAFYGCESLAQITFPEKLQTIGYKAFYGCKSLKRVVLPPKVKISRESFDEHTAVVIPEAASAAGTPAAQDIIEKKAFAGSDITSLEVEEGIKKIKEQAYKDCKALKTVSLPRSLTDLGAGVFDGCQMLSSVTYHGNSLIKIGKNAFRGTKFEKEYIKDIESTSSPCTLSEKTMVCLGSTLLFCQVNTEEVIIPAGIEGIAPFAFQKCYQLKRVSIPQTVKWIAKETFIPEKEKSPSPSLEIFAAPGGAAEKYAKKELAFFVPIPPEKAEDNRVFEEYSLIKDTEYKKQYFSHLYRRAESDATSDTWYNVICKYQQAIPNDGDDIFVDGTEVKRLFADPDFLNLFYEGEQRVIRKKSGIFVEKDRIIPSEVDASFLIKLLAALVAFSESPVKATIGLNKDKWEYRGDYGSSSKLYVGIDQYGRVYARLERQRPWDM